MICLDFTCNMNDCFISTYSLYTLALIRQVGIMSSVNACRNASKVVSFFTGPGVLIHMPLHVPVLFIGGALSNLKQPHRHARSHFRQFHALMARLNEDVMPHLDTVLNVFESHHSAAQLGCDALAWGEEMLENLDHSLAEWGGETVEDEVGVRFGDGAAGCVGNVVTEEYVVKAEGSRWPVGKMRDGEGGGSAAVFVQEDDVCQTAAFGTVHEVGQDEVAAIESDGGGEEKADFFGKGAQAGTGVARGGHQHARVYHSRQVGVFVVQIQLFLCRALGATLIVLVVLAQGLVVGNGRIERLPTRQGLFQLCPLLRNLGVSKRESATVQIVSPLSGLSFQHRGRCVVVGENQHPRSQE